MKAENYPFLKIISSDPNAREHYHVPRYQREYAWGKIQWEKLIHDIEENDLGYFMGSFICVHDAGGVSPGAELIYEIVDGQQRLITLSLLIAAIYKKVKNLESSINKSDEDELEESRETLAGLRNRLVRRKKDFHKGETGGFLDGDRMLFLRVQPSTQNNNLVDYVFLLGELELVAKQAIPKYWGLRPIAKTYKFFLKSIPDDFEGLRQLARKIGELAFVLILVPSQSNAFILFETLNNRGVPLSAIDIIKNKMLAEMEKQKKADVEQVYEEWQQFLRALPEAEDQERFLRQFYNVFKIYDGIRIDTIPRATKPKIIEIYEALIKRDVRIIFDEIKQKAEIYSQFTDPAQHVEDNSLRNALLDLSRIGAAPAYQVLLYLFALEPTKVAGSDFKIKVVELLCKYNVRRNITDVPSTRELDPAHIELIENCEEKIKADEKLTLNFIEESLISGRGKPASLDAFREVMENSIYASNAWMARHVLIKLNDFGESKEYNPDLWARNDKGKFVWTVEHVLPQGENLPDEWVEMIAGGNKDKAEIIQGDFVHRLGNLTLSGYNSELSNAPFDLKQAKRKGKKFLGQTIDIGYKNGLALNNLEFDYQGKRLNLATIPEWTPECIEARTRLMVNRLIEYYKFTGE